MAFEIEENINTPKIQCITSVVIELFSAVQTLAQPSHHTLLHDWVKKNSKVLSERSHQLLEKIAKFPFHGLSLFEYVLDIAEFFDIDVFINQFNAYSNHQIVSVYTDHCINKALYDKLMKNEIKLETIEKEYPWLFNDTLHELDCILFETSQFKKDFVHLLREIYSLDDFHKEINHHKVEYEEVNHQVLTQLKTTKPLDVAQAIMGKKFGRVFDYPLFIFCPSYFSSPHKLRIHNEKMIVVIYDLYSDFFLVNQKGEEIANTLKVISDRTRLEILRRLSIGPTYGKLLANSLDLTTATISHHLEQLKSVGLVKEEKQKNTKFFSLNHEKLHKIIELTSDYILHHD